MWEEAMKQFCLGIIVAIGFAIPAFGQGIDPLIGTWKYNPQKSTGFAFTFPKSQILTWVAGEGGNLINTAETPKLSMIKVEHSKPRSYTPTMECRIQLRIILVLTQALTLGVATS
jgi:hypothetical protein